MARVASATESTAATIPVLRCGRWWRRVAAPSWVVQSRTPDPRMPPVSRGAVTSGPPRR